MRIGLLNFYSFFCLTFVFSTPNLRVAAALPEGTVTSLELRINSELEKVIALLVTEKRICEELWLDWPLKDPQMNKDEIEKDVKKIIRSQLSEKFPLYRRQFFEEEAKSKFKLFKIGEEAKFKLKDGASIEGYLREKNNNEILLDNRTIELGNIAEEYLYLFDRNINKTKQKEYVRAKLVELEESKRAFRSKIRNEISQKKFIDSGYIMVNGEWITQKEFAMERLKNEKEKLGKNLKPHLKTKIYYDSGFVLFNKEWMTKKKAEVLRKQLLDARKATSEGKKIVTETSNEGIEEDEKGLWD